MQNKLLVCSKKLFVAFLGINRFHRVEFKIMCWFYVGNTQRLTESGFMEKQGIEPVTPGLQGIALIHYTTAACSCLPHWPSVFKLAVSLFHFTLRLNR